MAAAEAVPRVSGGRVRRDPGEDVRGGRGREFGEGEVDASAGVLQVVLARTQGARAGV